MRLAKEEMPTEGLKRVSQRVNQVPVVLNPVLNGKEIRRTSINRTDFDIKLQDYHKYIQETC